MLLPKKPPREYLGGCVHYSVVLISAMIETLLVKFCLARSSLNVFAPAKVLNVSLSTRRSPSYVYSVFTMKNSSL